MQPSDQLAASTAYPAIPLLSNILKSTSRGFSGAAHGPYESSLRTQTRGRTAARRYENSNLGNAAAVADRQIRRRPIPRPKLPSTQNAQRNYERYLELARAETLRGDKIAAENFLQHAEHYLRSMREHTH